MKSLRSITALGAFFVVLAVAIAGCGSSSSGVPSDSVAVVAGNPITTKAFKHWMFVAAQGQAAQSPGSPVIVPDPPNYTQCMADAGQGRDPEPREDRNEDPQVRLPAGLHLALEHRSWTS